MNSYQDSNIALKYLGFLNSENGQIQQKILAGAVLDTLPKNRDTALLDAACGTGWLAGELKMHFNKIDACDSSDFFIQFGRAHYGNVDFKTATLDKTLPYGQNFFDAVILNMAAPDLKNLAAAFKNLAAVLKPGGKLLATIPNPAYTYPAAEWKRTWLDILLFKKPGLRLKTPPVSGAEICREFNKGSKIKSFYYNLKDYQSAGGGAKLSMTAVKQLRTTKDSKKFDLAYQLYRYPLLLLLEFEKV